MRRFASVIIAAAVFGFVGAEKNSEAGELIALLNDGGYILRPEDLANDADRLVQEMDALQPAIREAVLRLSEHPDEAKGRGTKENPVVFEVGVVVASKKSTRRIDFISWGRSFEMRGMGIGKRYVGTSFDFSGIRSRLYIFFVYERDLQKAAIRLESGRSPLNAELRNLFAELKNVTRDEK